MKCTNITLSRISIMLLLFLTSFVSACTNKGDNQLEPVGNEDIPITPFSVMSFNIRHHNDKDPQPLDYRKTIILKCIEDNGPDIVGLQEFSNDWFEQWMKDQMTKIGYSYYSNASAGYGSPKVIFYKKGRFVQKAQATFQMIHTEKRTGTWIILYDKLNDNEYFISNSHWTTVSSAERVQTAKKVATVVTESYRGLPSVIFGDFNAKPGTPEINIIKNIVDMGLTSAHDDDSKTFTGWDQEGRSKIDWIFYSNKLELIESSVIKTSYNGYWPSDHWPIVASFKPIIEVE